MYLIRSYYPGDAGEVDALAVLAFSQYACFYDDWPGLREKLHNMSKLAETGDLFVAECGGRLLGAVAYIPPGAKAAIFRREWAVMRMLVVAPDARGRGIGRALLDFCLERARWDGAAEFALHTSPIMKEALRLYLRAGFRLSHEVPPFHGVPYGVYVRRIDEVTLNPAECSISMAGEYLGSRN